MTGGNFEIGQILHLKSEISKYRIGPCNLHSPIYNFGFEIQDSIALKASWEFDGLYSDNGRRSIRARKAVASAASANPDTKRSERMLMKQLK